MPCLAVGARGGCSGVKHGKKAGLVVQYRAKVRIAHCRRWSHGAIGATRNQPLRTSAASERDRACGNEEGSAWARWGTVGWRKRGAAPPQGGGRRRRREGGEGGKLPARACPSRLMPMYCGFSSDSVQTLSRNCTGLSSSSPACAAVVPACARRCAAIQRYSTPIENVSCPALPTVPGPTSPKIVLVCYMCQCPLPPLPHYPRCRTTPSNLRQELHIPFILIVTVRLCPIPHGSGTGDSACRIACGA